MSAQLAKLNFSLVFASFGVLAFVAPRGLWIPIVLLLLQRMNSLKLVSPGEFRRIFTQLAGFLILPAYAALSTVWAVVPGDALVTSAKLFGYCLSVMAVVVVVGKFSDAEKRSAVIWAAVGFVVASVIVWIDLVAGGLLSDQFKQTRFTPNKYSRGAAIAAFVVLPIALGLYRRAGSRQAFAFAAVCFVTIFALQNEAASLAAISGVIVYVVVRWRSVLFWPIVLFPIAVGIVFPALFSNGLNNDLLCQVYNTKLSAAHRLVIYDFSSRHIFEKPLLGWGMDSSRSIPGGNGTMAITDCPYEGKTSTTHKIIGMLPLHPHSGALQVWLELGAAGVVIFIGLLGISLLRLHRGYGSRDGRPMIAGLFTSIFLVYNISFGLWQSWLIFALILLSAIVGALRPDGHETDSTPAKW
jgi:O-antigen ligase